MKLIDPLRSLIKDESNFDKLLACCYVLSDIFMSNTLPTASQRKLGDVCMMVIDIIADGET